MEDQNSESTTSNNCSIPDSSDCIDEELPQSCSDEDSIQMQAPIKRNKKPIPDNTKPIPAKKPRPSRSKKNRKERLISDDGYTKITLVNEPPPEKRCITLDYDMLKDLFKPEVEIKQKPVRGRPKLKPIEIKVPLPVTPKQKMTITQEINDTEEVTFSRFKEDKPLTAKQLKIKEGQLRLLELESVSNGKVRLTKKGNIDKRLLKGEHRSDAQRRQDEKLAESLKFRTMKKAEDKRLAKAEEIDATVRETISSFQSVAREQANSAKTSTPTQSNLDSYLRQMNKSY